MHVRWNDTDKRISAAVLNNQPTTNRETKSKGSNDKAVHSDLYQALFPIYYLGKLCGLVPVRFVPLSMGRYQIRQSYVDIVYSFVLMVLLMALETWGLWRDWKDGWAQSTRLKSRTAVIATCSDILGVMALTCVCIMGSPSRWKYLQDVMDRLVVVDEKIGLVAPKKTRRFTIVLTVCTLAYLWIASIFDIVAWTREVKISKKMADKGAINYAPLYFMYTVIITTEIQYGVSAYNVGQRFLRLNKSLEIILRSGKITDYFRKDLGLGKQQPETSVCNIVSANQTVNEKSKFDPIIFLNLAHLSMTFTVGGVAGDLRDHGFIDVHRQDPGSFRAIKTKSYAVSISELITVHSSLCDTISCINSAFGIAVLAVTVTCLLHLIITPYFLILQADGDRQWLFLVVQLLWCLFHVTRMLIIVQPAYSTVAEGKKTSIIVSQLLSSNCGNEAKKELEIFSLQLLHRPLDFSACGLFSLDRTLVTSIAGAVTTYLVILIQFQNADDTKGDFDMIKNASQFLKNASSLQNLTLKLAA